ncbi:MAG: M14 family zinc carboxypeptidase [Sediminibacterium sp.]|nr:M14 family zinc carboxypeptidase [Sediminibacterium sp.]
MNSRSLLFIAFSFCFCLFGQAQGTYFYPEVMGKMNPSIPTPEKFLGYAVGSQHTRHDKIVEYIKELSKVSNRVTYKIIGETYEHRQQIAAIFTSPANQGRLEEIRKAHLAGQLTGNTANVPLVIHLGYNVHGNEPSSSEAALLTAYYLTACENEETIKWLNEMVILMDPNINPDGRDRHTNWVNMHKAEPAVADPADREHNEIWPGGRFNHYWFDLNRDWFLGTFPESRNRIRFFHEWRPYVQTDHHEQGTNSTHYFDPGKYSSNNPVVPDYLYNTIYPKYATYFAGAMNKIGSLYFTKEAFDKLYPGYGSSYINFYGGAGFLFEQASSRGHVQETTTIPLTFAFTIRNHFTMSMALIRASNAEKKSLLTLRSEFYKAAADQAKKSTIKSYLFGDAKDETRNRAFLSMLLMHQIEVYENEQTITAEGTKFIAGKSYSVPVEQANYIMVKSIFEKAIPYTDSTFYDASTWSLIHAYGLPYAEMKTAFSKGKQINSLPLRNLPAVQKSNYAYAFELNDYNTHKANYLLQKGGAIVQTAFKPFTVEVNGQPKSFGYGSISIPVYNQLISADSIFNLVKTVSEQSSVTIHSLTTGYSTEGIDLGSGLLKTVMPVKAAMLIGSGVGPIEAGEIWHLLDERLAMPITKIDLLTFNRVKLERYNTLIMVSGNYSLLDKANTDKIKAWVQNGGTLITIKSATEWAIKQGMTKEKILPAADTVKATEIKRLNFDIAADNEGSKSLGGSIFFVDLDTTHPIGFGFSSRKVSVYRNAQTYLAPSINPYSTVAQYTNNPLIGGYLHPISAKKIKNTAAIVVAQEGEGRVILFTDNPNFRGTWYGTNKLFLNALFFGNLINVPRLN